ncbi:MAG TPA: GNAT family N-acetyltransferase, partial [Pseudomonas sp.]|nr:GNAT family N-acetyltransferase [Pseudomonas sp.]
AMLDAYPASPDTYIYGPICVTEHERGHGLAQLMFDELCRLEPDREGILFVGKSNEASMHAHLKMGMKEVASFTHHGSEFAVFSFRGQPAS